MLCRACAQRKGLLDLQRRAAATGDTVGLHGNRGGGRGGEGGGGVMGGARLQQAYTATVHRARYLCNAL